MKYDAAVIGGGIFGCTVALHLKKRMRNVVLYEQELDIIMRASYHNQARIHNGYHYPRSIATGVLACSNYEPFLSEFGECIVKDFTALYGIARFGSKVTTDQFTAYCDKIGAQWDLAHPNYCRLFNGETVGEVFEVKECAIDAAMLRGILRRRLADAGVELRLGHRVASVTELYADKIFNCTYAGLHGIRGLDCDVPLKYQLTEIALIKPPKELYGLAVAVMDGPFFSTMPFPPSNLYSISHVALTPHLEWTSDCDRPGNPYLLLSDPPRSSAPKMLKSAARYLPCMETAKIVDSFWEIKTLLAGCEKDDSRPTVMQKIGNVYAILGGKLDSIFDVIDWLKEQDL